MNEKYITSESVTEGHPDKICDQISDLVLDELLKNNEKPRVACETFVTKGLIIVGGEITTESYVDLDNVVREKLRQIGYTSSVYGLDCNTCGIIDVIGKQSPDIAQGVDTGGAGDQGIMIGYACRETPELMPFPISLAHKLAKQLTYVRKQNILDYLGPDGKTQVTLKYEDDIPKEIVNIVISTQHTEKILDKKNSSTITNEARKEIINAVVKPIIPENMLRKNTKYYINPTGKFLIGGPVADSGLTGRKIIVDTYGGVVAHGGGCFSGKDPTKVDRSGAYIARYIAKNIVASGIAQKCLVQLAYVIGVAEPVSIFIDCFGTSQISNEKIIKLVRENFKLTPKGIIDSLDLMKPKYCKTAAYGHFGREEEGFTWERTDKAELLEKN
ncbi:MAG: methionine adenosyltransferase [Candidatus Aenigmarchaeota archaeon ex4484_52]|nr:MAG: methionine adenosyltransferase [Candidatus Aenigmarchaeota archaeon ex4484_52]